MQIIDIAVTNECILVFTKVVDKNMLATKTPIEFNVSEFVWLVTTLEQLQNKFAVLIVVKRKQRLKVYKSDSAFRVTEI